MLTVITVQRQNHGRMRRFPAAGFLLLVSWLLPAASLPAQNQPRSMDDFFRNWTRMSPEQRAELRQVDVPWRIELDQGRQTFEAYRRHLQQSGITVSGSSADAQYLKKLVARVHPLMKNSGRYRQIEVYVANSPDVDARSIPGGYLVFHRGLLEFADSEAAVVGIIGHELSHLDRKHQLKPVQQWIRTSNQLSRANRMNLGDFFSLGQNMMNSFHPFHPEEEEEADLDGAEWMHRLGYDARELARLFQRLGERPGPGDPPAGMPAFLRTHPMFPDRAVTTLRHYQLMQRPVPRDDLVVGREALAKREPAELPEPRHGRQRR